MLLDIVPDRARQRQNTPLGASNSVTAPFLSPSNVNRLAARVTYGVLSSPVLSNQVSWNYLGPLAMRRLASGIRLALP